LIPGVPVVGFYSFGEQGQSDCGVNRHNNVVIAVLTLGREFSYGAQVALENEQLRLKLEQQTADLMTTNNKLLHEIGERHRAEEALSKNYRELQETAQQLEESRGVLQLILESIPVRVFWKDTDLRYLGCNTLFALDAGLSQPEQLLGQDDFAMGWREQAELYRADDRQTMESGRPKMNIVEPQTTPAGTKIWLNTSKVPLRNPSGEVFGVLGVYEDITERKRAEEEKAKFEAKLVHTQKMEAIGTLAGGIAHDFNNILTAIIGNISLAMLDQKEGPGQERLNEAERACLRAQMLARQLLTFATGGAPVKVLITIEKLVTESTSFASSGSNVKCEFNFPDNLWAVKVDPGQINQVVQNLVINAMQAMPTGGTIEVRGENLMIDADSNLPLDAGRYVKISFQDQGIGIPKEYLSKIFDPYFTTKQKGSGLGLATAYSIIKNHQGHVGVESRFGGGTIFYIYLPATDQGIIEPQPDEKKILNGQGKILIMDDDVMIRDILKDMLQKLGYEAYCTVNGEEAIKSYKEAIDAKQPFAAAVFDLTIPGAMGGKDAIRKLLEIDPHIKVKVSSGYSDDPIMANYKKYKFRDVISKPYRIIELSKVLFKVTMQH